MLSGRPNFNRTKNDTIFPPPFPGDRNRSNDSDFGFNRDPFDESPEIMFYLLIPLVIPSIVCSLFLFYNFLRLPHLRTRPSNFLIICLLIINFIHVNHSNLSFSMMMFSFSFASSYWSIYHFVCTFSLKTKFLSNNDCSVRSGHGMTIF